MFFADLQPMTGVPSYWAGISYAWTTMMKGNNDHRVRFFGLHTINQTATDAWLSFANGTIIDHLAVAQLPAYQYITADYRMNDTIFAYLLSEGVFLTIASESFSSGAVTGFFMCRPNSGVAILTAASVPTGSTSTAVGMGWAEVLISDILNLPQDILAQDNAIANSLSFNGRIITNSSAPTAASFNGPANLTSTAAILASASSITSYFYDCSADRSCAPKGTIVNDNNIVFSNITVTSAFAAINVAQTYYQVTDAFGGIRGQVYPLVTPTRRSIPYAVDSVLGTTVVPIGGFSTLRYANQEGNENNKNSYLSATAAQATSGSNFTYQALFHFQGATNRHNFEIVRGYTVEMNVRISGAGAPWLFELFDSTTSTFIPIGTITTANSWTPAFVDYYQFDVSNFVNIKGQLTVRVSVNSAIQTSLAFDLFGVRAWTPNSVTNGFFKDFVKILDKYPGVFANGTTIH